MEGGFRSWEPDLGLREPDLGALESLREPLGAVGSLREP